MIEVGLFAWGKFATAFLVLALVVGVVCFMSAMSDMSNQGLWVAVIACFFVVTILGVFAVPSEWQTKVTQQAQKPVATNTTPVR